MLTEQIKSTNSSISSGSAEIINNTYLTSILENITLLILSKIILNKVELNVDFSLKIVFELIYH